MRLWPKLKDAPPPDPRHPIANMVARMLADGWNWQAIILQIRTVELATEQRTQVLVQHVAQQVVTSLEDVLEDYMDDRADLVSASEEDARRRAKDAQRKREKRAEMKKLGRGLSVVASADAS